VKNLTAYGIAVLLAVTAGCASKPPPAPPPPPKPVPVVAPPPVTVAAPKPAVVHPKKVHAPAPARPSVATTTTITFAGEVYTLKYQGTTNGEVLRQYYTGAETSQRWTRLVELHVYPTAGKNMSAPDYAALVAKNLQAANPYAEYTLQTNKADGSATLNFSTWNDATLKAHYTEFDAFKFMAAPKTGDIIGFHYVENLYTDLKATTEQNRSNSEAEKQRVVLETAKVPLYQE